MLTTTETAKELGVSRQTVLTYIKKGKLKASRYDRQYRVSKEEIKRLKGE